MKRLGFIIVVLGLSVGCRPKSKPEPPQPTATSATIAAEPADAGATAEVEPVNPTSEPAAGPPCIDDQSCSGYLRCEQGHCTVPPAVAGRVVPGMPSARFVDGDKELGTIMLEIADDRGERTRGLMYRREMHPDFGMLFIFNADEERSFWMKNTLIALDMVHIDSHGLVVGVVERAEPMTLSPRATGKPARYVLELVAGRASELGIHAGSRMLVDGLPQEQSPRE